MVSICPRCFSTSITTTDRAALAAYRELYFRCRGCGLEAKLFPEVAINDLPKLQEERNERKKSVQSAKAEKPDSKAKKTLREKIQNQSGKPKPKRKNSG